MCIRDSFSNEAGLGSAPIAAAAAQTKEPVRQGLVSMTGTFLDTIVVCSMTGLALVMTGAYQIPGLEGAAVTTAAFQAGLPFIPGEVVSFVLMACLVLFGFTTILGWDYYGERCLESVSYTHLDVYKRQLVARAVAVGVLLVDEERGVRVHAREFGCALVRVDDLVDESQHQRHVGAGANGQPDVCLGSRAGEAGVDADDLRAALLRALDGEPVVVAAAALLAAPRCV